LNRFRTKKEQQETLKRVELGETDILVGTHRVLSKDVKFKNLGLLIIDEEHRFGVKAKEKIKEAEEFFDKKNLEDIQDNPEMMRYQEEVRKGRKRKPLEEFNIAKDKVAKMCFIAPQKEQFSPCIPWLESYFHIVFFSKEKDSFLNGEIILKDCTKGDGIRKVIDYFHE